MLVLDPIKNILWCVCFRNINYTAFLDLIFVFRVKCMRFCKSL